PTLAVKFPGPPLVLTSLDVLDPPSCHAHSPLGRSRAAPGSTGSADPVALAAPVIPPWHTLPSHTSLRPSGRRRGTAGKEGMKPYSSIDALSRLCFFLSRSRFSSLRTNRA